jgi:hypothetical protein
MAVTRMCVNSTERTKAAACGTFPKKQVSKLQMQSLPRILLLALAVVGVLNAQQRPEFEVATVRLSPTVQPGVPLSINLGTLRNGTVTLSGPIIASAKKAC